MHGQASGESSSTQLDNDRDEHEEYSVNKLKFDTTEKEIEELREGYQLSDDVTLRLLREDEMASKLGDEETVIYMEMFKLGFRLSI